MCRFADDINTENQADFSTCSGYGPNGYRTFDGMHYMFQGRCMYTIYHQSPRSVGVDMANCEECEFCVKVSRRMERKIDRKIDI